MRDQPELYARPGNSFPVLSSKRDSDWNKNEQGKAKRSGENAFAVPAGFESAPFLSDPFPCLVENEVHKGSLLRMRLYSRL